MDKVDRYLIAATRENTKKSYAAAVQHFEVEWGGFLPATADAVSRYLADYGATLSINTLKQRLAGLARWHIDQGFPDPTKAPIVRQVLRGIRATHPSQERQAKPLLLTELEKATQVLDAGITAATEADSRPLLLRLLRNKALLLVGFWRGFRSDELVRLSVDNVIVQPGHGMIFYLPHTKADRQYRGTPFKMPALAKLCPVEAYLAWQNLAQLQRGPVFRSIDRWGHVSEVGLHVDSVAPILRAILAQCELDTSDLYSSHSLRRGFANWAMSSGWDIKTLMAYIGWKDVQSAMRYVDAQDPFDSARVMIAPTLPSE